MDKARPVSRDRAYGLASGEGVQFAFGHYLGQGGLVMTALAIGARCQVGVWFAETGALVIHIERVSATETGLCRGYGLGRHVRSSKGKDLVSTD